MITIPKELLGRTIGFLSQRQEAQLAQALVLAYDLDIAIMG